MNELVKKWKPVLEIEGMPKISDEYRLRTTAVLLENQKKAIMEQKEQLVSLMEAGAPTNVTGNVDRFDPVLIKLVRRLAPALIAHDVCGVQPMTMPTGLIFAFRARYADGATSPIGTEALFNEADTDFSGTGTHQTDVLGTFGTGMATATGEGLAPAKMGFTIEKVSVVAKTRALQADYSMELAQDLKAVHNLDAETELVNILSTEILAEINREIIRTIYRIAEDGAQSGTAVAGTFDMDVDSDGRWSVEKFKGLLFQIEREANAIARRTRMGRGNFVIVSYDVASALAMAGKLDWTPALNTDLDVDGVSNTFAGYLNNKIKVFVDPYFYSASAEDLVAVGYKGKSPYDAGLFYCPYVPLVLLKAQEPDTFQPKLMFKTRYGIVSNPLNGDGTTLAPKSNRYYRLFKVKNIL
ncbi:MAG: ATP-binding protein [Patescibacteria group bacterium]|nr:ATP-binding protein [Patescibacteria group bacterium]